MLTILRETPLWAYALFFVITYYGIMACFITQETKLSLIATPTVFAAVSIAMLNSSSGYLIALSGFIVGGTLGWTISKFYYNYENIKIQNNELTLEGTCRVIVSYWCFFSWQYYIGYKNAATPEALLDTNLAIATSVVSGVATGLFSGRSSKLLKILKSRSLQE